MKLLSCPRCHEYAYETFGDYAFCHDCQFNTTEGTDWSHFILRKPPLQGTVRDPLRSMREKLETNSPVLPMFSEEDYSVVRSAVGELTPVQREVVYLHFWEGYNAMTIAYFLDMKLREVEAYIRYALVRLKALCLAHPRFSRSQEALPQAA